MHRIRPVPLDRSGPKDGSRDDESPIDPPDRAGATPERDALDRELGSRIAQAVARLPEKLRETWALAVGRGLPYPEIAQILEIPVGTVKSRMFQAVRLLRDDLGPYALEKDAEKDPPHDVR